MIRTLYHAPDGTVTRDLSPAEIQRSVQEGAGLLWVSLERPSDDETHAILRDVFHFHPLTIEDTQSTAYQAPKIDEFANYLFIIVHAARLGSGGEFLTTLELNLFLGRNYLVTSYQSDGVPAVEEVWKAIDRDERLLERGVDFLAHAVLDRLVDDYMPLIDVLDEEIEGLEDEVVAGPKDDTLDRILTLKHGMAALRRIIAPQREILNRLSRDEYPQIGHDSRIYFRDVYDHLTRIQDLSESMRDVTTGTLDTYLSVTSNKLNSVMKTLTVVSTIFLPLTFIAGVYGMNFHYMPELYGRYSYFILWGVFALIAASMLWIFRRRGWI